uniref:transcobalamin beta a n=1 Tax=Scatophagus argus TaxID=75038 RepID=UPI001ED82A38|nr:transcobalamin beta a [Scatophagus argus]
MVTMPALLSAALLLLLLPGTLTRIYNSELEFSPIDLVVENSLENTPRMTYSTQVAYRGILLGAMERLKASNTNFTFNYTMNENYGPYLESVNGVAGNDTDHTYWELLVKTHDGKIIRPDVGIGCYIPRTNEEIILKFTKW